MRFAGLTYKEKMLKRYAELIPALGTKTDFQLCKEFGISNLTIGKLRKLFDIPTYHATLFNNFPVEELGTASDRVLAEKYRVPMERVPPEDRFWIKVDKQGPVHPVLGSACWVWKANVLKNTKGKGGYGLFGITKGKTVYAHRYAWELLVGAIPEGVCVLHHCDNRLCVRVEDHLFLGTQLDNMRDCKNKGRHVNPAVRLSAVDVVEIRACRSVENKIPLLELSHRYGVAVSEISRIATGVRWPDVKH